jgi:pyruvate/2-oxoglutarate dehydrogenase complex dihydrolipoamide dehydrogenase (E3) component
VIRSALFRLPARARADHVPRATYADPELAQVGLTEGEARAAHGARVGVARAELSGNDRARAERETAGFVKLMIGPGGRLLGATAVGPQAGEIIQIAALAMAARLKVGALAGMVAPYPTLGEAVKRAAGAHFAPRLFGNPWVRGAIGVLARFG